MKKPVLIILLLLIFIISGISFLLVKSSRDVISAFGEMDNKLSKSSVFVEKENDSLLNAIKDENLLVKANQVDSLITNFKEYLESIKQEMLGGKGPKNYELMDQQNNMFFTERGLSEKGKEFITKTDQIREELLELVETPELETKISNILSTGEVHDRDGRRRKWLEFNFKDFPLIASITRLTQMQSGVIILESDIYKNYIIGQE
ncbi:hypothetical protein [uncultured Aquimarina sp.]|uniref:hypothetical protein n=1 Tax=uncultured Aquimarina sp. TaxID=575652 RepID=UPI0026356F3E|nr:hypothetical protein [uncultured Aquimarina sp.]